MKHTFFPFTLFALTVLLLSADWGAAQLIFAPPVTYAIGSNPESLAVADVNGDGKLDIICGNAGDTLVNGSLSIYTNTGGGSFSLASTPSIGHAPTCIAAVDASNSGRIDLITANWDNGNGGTVSIWTNRGNGMFGSNVTINIGVAPRFVIPADIKGDGNLALICANYGFSGEGHTLTVLTNSGSGVYGSNSVYTVGMGSFSVAAVDINGDGKVDLISANTVDATLTILTNNGSGVFGSNTTLHVGSGPRSVAAINLNGKGKLDLITANWGNASGNTLTVFTNNGIGFYGSNTTYTVGTGPHYVTVADVNGDGSQDLVCANEINNTLSVLTNNGSGGLVTAAAVSAGSFGNHVGDFPIYVFAADFNGDGKPDLTCVNLAANTFAVLTNMTTYPAPTASPLLQVDHPGSLIRISWPSTSPGWTLQQCANMLAARWGPSGYREYSITDDGTNKNLTMRLPSVNQFFRLIHP